MCGGGVRRPAGARLGGLLDIIEAQVEELEPAERGEADEGADAIAPEKQHLQLRQRLEGRARRQQIVREVELDKRRERAHTRRDLEAVVRGVEMEH